MINQNSFTLDASNNDPNSSVSALHTFGGTHPKKSNQFDSRNEAYCDLASIVSHYSFKDIHTLHQIKKGKQRPGQILPSVSKQQHDEKMEPNKTFQKIQQKPSKMTQGQSPRGLLKPKMKVEYNLQTFKPKKSPVNIPTKPQKRSIKCSQVSIGEFSANLFSCMDAPEYERDFQVSPKVIARKNL